MISFSEFTSLIRKFNENSFKPPEYMVKAAEVGLKVRDEQSDSNKCCTPTGLARARDLSNGSKVSLETVKRIKSFVSRHGSNYKASYDKESKWWQGMMVWGVPYSDDPKTARENMDKVIQWADQIIQSQNK